MTIIEVEFLTLVSIIGAAVLGALLGAGVVSGFSDARCRSAWARAARRRRR